MRNEPRMRMAAVRLTIGTCALITVAWQLTETRLSADDDSKKTVQLRIVMPRSMKVWVAEHGRPFPKQLVIEVPGRINLKQGSRYRLKLTDIPGRSGVILYPTIEVRSCDRKTDEKLRDKAIPILITEDDFDRVAQSKTVTKVILLPHPKYQRLFDLDEASGGYSMTSHNFEPEDDVVKLAPKYGTVIAVIRIGNIDAEMEHREPRKRDR